MAIKRKDLGSLKWNFFSKKLIVTDLYLGPFAIGHFRVALASFSKRVFLPNHSHFDLHKNGHAGDTHFDMNDFSRRLILTQRQKVTLKWPIQDFEQVELGYTAKEFCTNA